MNIKIYPSILNGSINAPPSKSAAHRLIICAALSNKPTNIGISSLNDDIKATINVLNLLGADIKHEKSKLTINPIKNVKSDISVDVGESGSTLRFLIPVTAALGAKIEFFGKGRLPQRPLSELLNVLKGCTTNSHTLPLTLSGKLLSGNFILPGDVSSQYVSGLLFACPVLKGESNIILTSPLQSAPYVEMTVSALKKFKIETVKTSRGFYVKGGQQYISNGDYQVEGDYSSAAFYLVAGAIGGNITVNGLDPMSLQGDAAICDLLKDFQANVLRNNDAVTIKGGELKGINVDAEKIPDLVPILAVAGAFGRGITNIYNAKRLRIKESDRLKSTAKGLESLGVDVVEREDSLTIKGGTVKKGGTICGYNDHRIVMSFAIAASYAKEPVIIEGAEAVNKSYPSFFEDFKKLGGKFDVINNG